MRAKNFLFAGSALFVLTLFPSCDWMPGKPNEAHKWQNPHDIVDFETLYARNCRGCHGSGNEIGGALSLDNPAYLAVVPRQVVLDVVTNGIPNTSMPAFSIKNGGMLTDDQIKIVVDGIMAWGKTPRPGQSVPTGPLPPYAAAPGNAEAGKTLYEAYVAGARKAVGSDAMFRDGFLINPAFLGLSSDQYLRTLIIAGRPELGIPDWRSVIPGQPLSDQDIADVVAWLISQRKNEFGQPLTPGQQNEVP